MNLVWFLTVGAVLSVVLGEFGQVPFGSTTFSVSLTDILVGVILLLLLIWQVQTKTLPKRMPKIFLLLIVFWLVLTLSLIASFNFSGVAYLVRFMFYSSAIYLGYSLIKSKVTNYFNVLKVIVWSGLILSLLGFLQFIFYPDLEPLYMYGYDPHKNRLFSTFLDPNLLGAYLNICLVCGLTIFLQTKEKIVRLFYCSIVLLLVLAIILTFSRSAYLMLGVELVVFFSFISKRALGILAVFFVLLFLLVAPVRERIMGAFNIDQSASERIESWQNGLYLISQKPILGVGFNNLRESQIELQLLRDDQTKEVNSGSGLDSSILFIGATAGILGIISFVIFIGYLIFSLLKRIKSEEKVFAICLLAITFGIVANSQFINSLFFTPVIFLYYLLIGVWVSTTDNK